MNKKLKLFFPLISCAITFSATAETNLNVKTDDFQTTVNITSYYQGKPPTLSYGMPIQDFLGNRFGKGETLAVSAKEIGLQED